MKLAHPTQQLLARGLEPGAIRKPGSRLGIDSISRSVSPVRATSSAIPIPYFDSRTSKATRSAAGASASVRSRSATPGRSLLR